MMFESFPIGWFVRDLLIFNGLHQGGYAAKGFVFQPPDLNNARPNELNEFQDQISLLLASLNDRQRLQIQYYCDSDYRSELLRYQQETRLMDNPWTQRARNERFSRYWQQMVDRKLRRQRLAIYISRAITTSPKGLLREKALTEYYHNLLDQLEAEFDQVHEMLCSIFSGQGSRILPMNAADHYRHYTAFLNPTLSERFDFDVLTTFDPNLSIQENCWHSEASGQSDFGFFMDGHYHSVLALTRWPKTTHPGLIRRITDLPLLDYTVTVNVEPLPVHAEITKEEREHDRVAGDYASERKLSLVTVMEKKQRKIASLMQSNTLPFNVLFVIRVWDKTKEGLCAKTGAIKNAINNLNGAQYFESTLPSTSRKLFYQTWPGWTWGNYNARKLYAENRYLADMLPFSATFTGHLESAEALYEGSDHNLVGIKTFSGNNGNGAPQHAVLFGMSGTGKSVTVCDLLSQTEGYFAYTVIVEEGLSYGIYTQTVEPGAKPIVIQPDGDLTINYLDTKGLPLSPDHLASATALVARMVGACREEDKQMHRQALIAKFINLLYEDVYTDWARRNASRIPEIARHACALSRFRQEKMPPGATSLEAFAEFRDWKANHEDEARKFLQGIDEAEVLKFSKEPNTAREVRNLAFAYFKPEEYPTHRMLQELMHLEAAGSERDQIVEIATLMLPWNREGNYGCLFDGTSNLSLTGKIAHFELGYIPDSAKELKSAAGLLITNDARKHIVTLPRALRKRNVYEEVARFLDIPGGEEIVRESYAQLRKFNCWNIAIVQQYDRFKHSRVRSAVIGNSRQFLLMRQNDRADLEHLSRDIAIPEVTQHAIMNYPLPDHQAGDRFSAFTYLHLDARRPICGTVRNIASPEMLYCSSSSGEHFEKRARQLKRRPDIVQGIIEHATREHA